MREAREQVVRVGRRAEKLQEVATLPENGMMGQLVRADQGS
ncbi:hypothetical protein [Brevibacillus sp. SIMBA_076]